jgi:hypothetical protein
MSTMTFGVNKCEHSQNLILRNGLIRRIHQTKQFASLSCNKQRDEVPAWYSIGGCCIVTHLRRTIKFLS